MSALECRDLTVRYGDVVAVDGVSFTVERGEIFGLLGPNGAGKTSVIRALTTIVPLAGGAATVAGHPIEHAEQVRAQIGVLPESSGYPGAQTARSYLRFYGQLFGLAPHEADRRAERLLAQFGLGDRHRRIATFSRGMRQRLGLARALVNDPAVLFLDEPTLGLDPAGKEEIMRHLARIALDDGTCIVLCSHLLDEVERVCDRIGILDHGRSVAHGTVDDVVTTAGVSGFGTVRVSPDDVGLAASAIEVLVGAGGMQFDNARPGDIRIDLGPDGGSRATIVRALLDHGVDVRSFDLQGARLSDAFLALTAPHQEQR
jgi:ABC-2 type transport system ATP-binding protein